MNHKFECQICNKHFSTKYNLKRHLKSCIKITKYPCILCGSNLTSKSNLKSHLINCFNNKRTRSDLEIYKTNDNKLKCILCNKTFKNKTCLKIHLIKYCKSKKTDKKQINTNYISKNNNNNVYIYNNVTNNIVNNYLNVNLTCYLTPNVKYIDLNYLVANCIGKIKGAKGDLALFEHVWANLNHPENHSIRLKNKRKQTFSVHVIDNNSDDDSEESYFITEQAIYMIPKISSFQTDIYHSFWNKIKKHHGKDKILMNRFYKHMDVLSDIENHKKYQKDFKKGIIKILIALQLNYKNNIQYDKKRQQKIYDMIEQNALTSESEPEEQSELSKKLNISDYLLDSIGASELCSGDAEEKSKNILYPSNINYKP